MTDPDESLTQYVQLQALKQSQTVLFAALASLLLEIPTPDRRYWLQRLAEHVQESLRESESDHSAAAGLLGTMFRGLFDLVEPSNPPGAEDTTC